MTVTPLPLTPEPSVPLTLVDALPPSRGAYAPVLRRLGFTFSADGAHAACLATTGDSGWYPESWWLGSGSEHSAAGAAAGGTAAGGTAAGGAAGGIAGTAAAGGAGAHPAAGQGGAGSDPESGLGEAVPVPLVLGAGSGPESLHSQLVSLRDGRVLICRHQQDRQELVVRAGHSRPAEAPGALAGGPGVSERSAGTLRMPGVRLLALPGTHPGGPVAVALGSDARPVTSVWLVSADGAAPQQVAEFPGLAGGGVWLDRVGRMLALDHVRQGGQGGPIVKTVALDLATGTMSPLLELAPDSNDRLVLADPDSGLIIVRSDAAGADRLGWGVLGGDQPLRFPDCLHQPQRFLRPVAVEPPTDPATPAAQLRVALQGDWGAGSSLAVWRPAEGRCEPLPIPAGRFGGVAHWSAAGLRLPYSAPDHPAGLATVDVDRLRDNPPDARPAPTMPLRLAPLQGGSAGMNSLLRRIPKGGTVRELRPVRPGWRLDGSAAPSEGGRWHPARTVELLGAAGRLEAVVYGGDSWLSAQHLVIALHGGPADAWRMEFDPPLQRMAAEGLSVVAPNQRGSSGYGVEHAQALQDAWGGPDLDDVLTLLSSVSGQRVALGLEPASLFGVSYGAFLALLATCTAPALVARCAVVAPFLSGARLLQEATEEVRSLTERMGGAREPADGRGPRDVLLVCHQLATPLLVVHGDRDEVVPVSQSRTLRQELLRIGRVEGADFRYVEATGAGHEVLSEECGPVLHELLATFLRTGRAT
ncbi:S9 family peptidase [Streptacidiphilus sp. P02-A3a]|uniref:alpha/beta hydrolase family protein n=1 Tax=Streptacidiphilus sp. P02-A3a TaxID=2704468 RepID=UPI00272D91BF|nr:alpha/beta fold hydrolase [Streptacidiphilus sp. P02-A3a]QMU68341.1 prolyl oligopeptidase family serine peptidase [Streptacidiphilus sp. P02-A3a]